MTQEVVAIVGSRGWPKARLHEVQDYVSFLPNGTIILSGGAVGVDTAAEEAARQLGMEVRIHKPNYDLYGPRAPLIRNITIAEECTRMVAFWDGISTGTMHVVRQARARNKLVEVFQ